MKTQRTLLLLVLGAFLVLATASAHAQYLTSTDRSAIIDVVHHAVARQAGVRIVGNAPNYARVSVSMQGTDPATVYVHKQAGRWKVIAGPGTAWSPAELDRLGIPRSLR